MDPANFDYRQVPCPHCKASAGTGCKRPSGHSGPFVLPHKARLEAARALTEAQQPAPVASQAEPEQPTPPAPPAPGTQFWLF